MLKMTLAAGVLALSALAMPATAATFSPQSMAPQSVGESNLAEQVHWRRGYRRCGFWRRECASRWGWGSRRFHRCLWRHAC